MEIWLTTLLSFLNAQVGGAAVFWFPSILTSFITFTLCCVAVIMEVITPAPYLFQITTTAWEGCDSIKQLPRLVLTLHLLHGLHTQRCSHIMEWDGVCQTGDRKLFLVFCFVLFFWAVVFTLIHSASILPSLNALCSFSGIYWNLVYWYCWDKLPVGEHTAAPLTLQYKNHKTCVAQDCSWYKGMRRKQ